MTTTVPLRWRSFAMPKRGNSADEYEDAFAGDPDLGRFAVADGATESSFAGQWAKHLVEGFIRPEADAEAGWLGPPRRRWAAEVSSLPLPWYAEEKREQGAFATFLGLVIRPPAEGHSGRWKALAVGDSCVFQVRQDRLLAAFPVGRSADFGNQPALLGSRSPVSAKSQTEWGKWKPGDRLFVMTDALAQWFLRRHEENRAPWRSLAGRLELPDSRTQLTAYVESLRDTNEMRNDDVTLLLIEPQP